MSNQDLWEVKVNGGVYGRHTGPNAEKQARDNYRMRMEPRPKSTYSIELLHNGVKVDSGTSAVKGSSLTPAK